MISCCCLFLSFFPFEDVVGALLFIDRRKSFTRKQKFWTSKDPIKNRTEKPKTVHNSRKKPSPMVVQLTKASFGSLPCQFFGTDHAQNWPFVWNLIIGEPKLASHCPYWFSHRQLAELRVAESFVKKKMVNQWIFISKWSLRHFQGTHVDKKIFLSRYVKNGICLNRVCLEGPPLLFLPKVPTNT